MDIISALSGPADVPQLDYLRQLARDTDWGGAPLSDAEWAAEEVLSGLLGGIDAPAGWEANEDCVDVLRAALLDAAERDMEQRPAGPAEALRDEQRWAEERVWP